MIRSVNLCSNDSIKGLDIENMPTLDTVYVWETFPTGVDVDTDGSPNVVFIDCSSTGIDTNSPTGLSIYPNPTDGTLTIETEHPDHYSLEITSLNGQVLLERSFSGSSHAIDLANFQKGVYFITIRSENYVTTKKIIKL